MELTGRLSSFSLGDVIQWVGHERRSGALVLRRRAREKRLYFQSGRLRACLSDDPAEFYGDDLLLHGDLTEKQLMGALAHCAETGQRLGEALAELRILSPERVKATLKRRIEDAVYDLFLWRGGVFFFEAEGPPEAEILPDPLPVMGLVLEGVRLKDEHGRMRRLLPHDDVVLRRGGAARPERLTPREERILAGARESATLTELYRETRGSYLRFFASVHELCLRELLDIVNIGEAPAETTELSLKDLLFEQAAEEERRALERRGPGLPMEVLEHLCPLWVCELPADERRPLSPELAAFADRLTGEHPLDRLLPLDPPSREPLLDFLWVQLRRGRLALVPGTGAAGAELAARRARAAPGGGV
jgi:hypothetical protein